MSRLIAGELMMADVRERLVLSPMADSGPAAVFKARDEDLAALHRMRWGLCDHSTCCV